MNKKILIVEDDKSISDALSDLLTDEGFSVEQVYNGQEAIDFLKSSSKPDVIVLDLMMPVLDGIGFRIEQLKDPILAPIPVVIMSADGNIKSKAEHVKVANYLKKPIDIDHLIRLVNSLV